MPRPIRPEIARQYSSELANAERMKDNPNIYGNPNVKFDPIAEMQALREANVTDDSFLDTSIQDWKLQGVLPMEEETTVNPNQETPEEIPSEDVPPEDPIEKIKWVATRLKEVDVNAPDAKQLGDWKNMHGNIFLFQISDDIYVYRYLKRQEWSQMMANPALQKMTQIQISDIIVEKCLLYPRLTPERKAFMPAGAPDTIAEQIKMQSQFLDPVQVANITIKL
jgi:hypothetical protein